MEQELLLSPQRNDAVKLGELNSSLGFLLRVAQVRVYDQFYERFGADDLRPGEFSMLWIIHMNPGIKQGLLAHTLRIKPAHMTKTVRRVEDQGLIEREIPDYDRRSVLLKLTEKGEAFVAANRGNFFGEDAYMSHDLSADEAATLARLLKRYCKLEAQEN